MTPAQFTGAVMRTLGLLRRQNPDVIASRHEGHETRPGHLVWMLMQAIQHGVDGKTDKANRWLGFVQGSMAADGYATVEELKRANMPEGETVDPGKV